jgi:hypothetical protein
MDQLSAQTDNKKKGAAGRVSECFIRDMNSVAMGFWHIQTPE